ncbi:conserved hypothetical protein [Truepera radiovictrix DSM 17093]|uniref:YtkA-like domain-containing protein n=2 Tax=Truepera TaxID=332248 RepID=D7CUM2_TRURR|nr:conserved hypothetical protein [Truepera radiovictrix DSM 17093]
MLLLCAPLSACRPPEAASGAGSVQNPPGVRVSLELPNPPAVGPAEVLVYVLDGSEGVSEAQVTVTGNMTHAGMEPVIAEAQELEPGLYSVPDFDLNMAGDWLLTAEVTLPDGARASADRPISVPGG